MRLLFIHAKYLILNLVRVPIMVISTAIFPALALLFFVVPQRSLADNPFAATMATTQLLVFSVMTSHLFSFSIPVAEDRSKPWEPFLRTLPAGPTIRIGGRLLTALPMVVLGTVPLIVVAKILTAATVTPMQALAGTGALLLGTLPFLFIGLAYGYSLTSSGAVAAAQLTMFPLAFIGGLLMAPIGWPNWLNTISLATPSRAARDLMVWATSGADLPATTLPVLAVWLLLGVTAAVVAFRFDQRARFK